MKKYKFIIIITYLLLATCGFAADYFYDNLPKVVLVKAQVGTVTDTVSYSGTIQAPIYHIISNSQTMIKDIYVQEEQYVEKGQLIARLDINNTANSTLSIQKNVTIPFTAGIDKNLIMEIINSSVSEEQNIIITQAGSGIHAPHSGFIHEIYGQTGEYTTTGKPLISIMDYNSMKLRVWIGEDRIHDIKIGQQVIISGNGFNGKYSGYVDEIDDKASQSLLSSSGSQVAVNISISDADDAILPGFTATATIRLGTRKNVVKIPVELIDQDQSGQEYIWIYNNGIVCKEYVQCKYSSSGFAEITNFDMESLIVSSVGQKLNDGDRVLLDKDWKTW